VSEFRIAASSGARGRIRSFSVVAWIVGAALMAGVAFNTYTDVGIGDEGLGFLGDADYPWQQAEPTLFESTDGDTWSGTGNGVIRIPLADHQQDPHVARLGDRGDNYRSVALFVSDVEDLDDPANDRSWPRTVGYLRTDEEVLVLPGDGMLELWIEGQGDWTLTLEKTEVDEVADGFAGGKGNAFLVYRGDAVSARFVHRGDGLFYVTIHPLGGEVDQPIIESGSVDERVVWDPTDAVYFSIESDDERGAWSIDIDELATDAPAPPETPPADPAPTDPAPTDPAPTDPAAAAHRAAPRTTAFRPTRGTPRR
jgi:hypothetical protein